jgi:hypothetical protein
VLKENAPGTTRDKRRRWLLTSGLAVCAICKRPLISATTGSKKNGYRPSYRCATKRKPGDVNCGGVSILADPLEVHVVSKVTEWLDDPAILPALNAYLQADAIDITPVRAELEQVDTLLANIAEERGRGDLMELEYAATRRPLLERRTGLLSQLAHAPVDPITVDEVLATWHEGHHREVIGVLVEKVVVSSAGRVPNLPIEDRVTVKFRA